jgi:carnitine 3-dehydrogenase
LRNENKVITATGEHMLIHVSLKTRAASEPTLEIREKLSTILIQQSKLPLPEGLGKAINMS